jgi:uncharacterized protein YndB with AHSA1/START domain
MPTHAAATRVLGAAPEDVWRLISDGNRLVAWWPLVERAEDVQGGRFTLVLRSSRGVPVRMDWRVVASRRDELQRWEQELAGTPFAKSLKRSVVEVRLERADDGGCRTTVVVEREMVQRGLVAGFFGRRAARRQAGDALARLARVAAATSGATR